MNRQEQLGWEARVGRMAAVAAFVSALFSVISIALQTSIGGADGERDALLRVDEDGGVLLASLGAQSVAYALLAFVLYFLLRAAAARRPQLPKALLPLVLLAPMLLIVGGFLTQLGVADVADEFVSSGPRTESRAEDLLEDRAILGPILGSAGTLCLAISFVMVGVNGMRVGLLSRFMGVLAIIVGALLVLPLIPGGQGVVQIFWTAALGALFLGRWPGGRGPAWESGMAEPWPTAADRRQASAETTEQPTDPVPGEGDDGAEKQASPARRKRKRRR